MDRRLTERLAEQEGGLTKEKSCRGPVESEARLSLRGREGGADQGLRRVGCVVMATRRDGTGCWSGLDSSSRTPLRPETQPRSSECPEPAGPR